MEDWAEFRLLQADFDVGAHVKAVSGVGGSYGGAVVMVIRLEWVDEGLKGDVS